MVTMRNRLTMTRATAVAAAALLTLGLAACSGSGDSGSGSGEGTPAAEEQAPDETPAEEDAPADEAAGGDDVCSAVEALTEASSAMGDVDPSDLQPTVDKLEELTATLEGVSEPPAEIADDWKTLTTSFRTAADGIGAAAGDPTDAEAMTKLQDAMSAMTGSEFQESAQAVGTYAGTHC